jgi:hypothetical protein
VCLPKEGDEMSWNIVQDAIDAIQNWFKGVLADGIVGSLQSTSNTLNSTFNTSNQGVMTSLLSDTPDKFTGSTDPNATPIWSGIETITNNAIVPIALFILIIVLVYELIQMVVSGNNFRDFDTSIFFKWSVKAVCGILLVSNVFYIVTNVFGFGSTAVTSGLTSLFPDGQSFLNSATISGSLRSNLVNLGIGDLVVLLILSFLIAIVTFIVLGAIIIVLASRMIEVFMYLSISPIPMATMMNRDWGEIGKNWLRNILALAFQGFFIVVALTIFKVLLGNVITQMSNIGSNAAAINGSMAMMLGYIVALIFTVFRSSNISKSVFSAH